MCLLIKVGSEYFETNQNDVCTCYQWAIDNGMEFNIEKCATVGLDADSRSIMLGDEPIKKVESYNYLGAPHKKYGIDFLEHLKNSSQSAIAFMNANAVCTSKWPSTAGATGFALEFSGCLESTSKDAIGL